MRNRNSRSDLFEERAVVALMEHLDPPPAASALGVSLRTLTRCMDKPAFQAARLRAAERAHALQQRIRLAQGLGPVVQSAATILLTAKTRPARLQAARLIETIVRAADEIEDFGAEVAQVQRDRQAREANQATAAGGPPRPALHATRLSRKQQQAITELLPRRSVAEAALAAGTSTGTLYRWLGEPAFVAALTEAVSALRARGEAGTQGLRPLRHTDTESFQRSRDAGSDAVESRPVHCRSSAADAAGIPAGVPGETGTGRQRRRTCRNLRPDRQESAAEAGTAPGQRAAGRQRERDPADLLACRRWQADGDVGDRSRRPARLAPSAAGM